MSTMLWFEAVQCFDVCSFCGRWEVRLPRRLPAGDLLGWRLFGLRAGTVHVSPSKTYVYPSPRRLSHGSKVHGDVYSFKTFQSSREEFQNLIGCKVQKLKSSTRYQIGLNMCVFMVLSCSILFRIHNHWQYYGIYINICVLLSRIKLHFNIRED